MLADTGAISHQRHACSRSQSRQAWGCVLKTKGNAHTSALYVGLPRMGHRLAILKVLCADTVSEPAGTHALGEESRTPSERSYKPGPGRSEGFKSGTPT